MIAYNKPLLTTPENTITYHNALCHPKILHWHCLQFLLGVNMAPRVTENNAYAKFWGDKQRVLWYVMVFSGVVCGRYLKGKETREEGGPLFMCSRALQCDDFNRGHLKTFSQPETAPSTKD